VKEKGRKREKSENRRDTANCTPRNLKDSRGGGGGQNPSPKTGLKEKKKGKGTKKKKPEGVRERADQEK